MRIRFSEQHGTIEIDGVLISVGVLKEIVDPDKRLLFRFQRENGIIKAVAIDERSAIWIDPEPSDQSTEFGVVNQNSNTEEKRP